MLEALRDAPPRGVRAPVQLPGIEPAERRLRLRGDGLESRLHRRKRQRRVLHASNVRMPGMKPGLFRLALLMPLVVAAGSDSVGAQAPGRGNRPVSSQPAPRDTDGHIVLGNTGAVKGVWIGGNLGFCNSNTVAPPASLNPGAT